MKEVFLFSRDCQTPRVPRQSRGFTQDYYVGYDALKPWRTGWQNRSLPYTHNWHALASLRVALKMLLDEGLGRAYARHAEVAAYCRQRLRAMNVRIFPKSEASSSPTVTAAYVPGGWTWERLDTVLRGRGMVVGGNYGPLAGKVFRIGHMGSQANKSLVQQGMDLLAEILEHP